MKIRIRDWDTHFERDRSRQWKSISWVPVPNKQGTGYRRIMAHKDGLAIYACWNAMLGVASKCNPRGDLTKYSIEDIAILTLIDRNVIEMSIMFLSHYPMDWIEIIEDTTNLDINVNEMSTTGNDTPVDSSILSYSILSNSKRGSAEGEKIEPTETGIVKSEKRVLYVPPWTTPEMQQKWFEWVKYRKDIKKPYKTDRGPKGTETDLRGLAGDDESLMILILNQSMDREWTGIFALKNPPVLNQYSTPGHPVFAGDDK